MGPRSTYGLDEAPDNGPVDVNIPPWTREYFERGYGQRWRLAGPDGSVRRDASALWNLLRLSSSSRVVDIGCGHGRYALALAEHGAAVVGLDFSASLLNRARDLAEELRTRVSWVRGDMRRLPCRAESVGGAVLMDAFGFFETDDEDAAVLREAARVLMDGARLVLKVVNGAIILNDFRATEEEERDGTRIVISNTLIFGPPRLIQRVRVSGARGDGEYERRQRLYDVDEMRAALGHAGLAVVSLFSSLDGAEFEQAASQAMWIVAERRRC